MIISDVIVPVYSDSDLGCLQIEDYGSSVILTSNRDMQGQTGSCRQPAARERPFSSCRLLAVQSHTHSHDLEFSNAHGGSEKILKVIRDQRDHENSLGSLSDAPGTVLLFTGGGAVPVDEVEE